ncbi:MAG: carotenoid biosynthesis protein, partial [Bacteroidia bacterium]|nr:carotenoid biosynthesis protein [Bacteroidia bacterium]
NWLTLVCITGTIAHLSRRPLYQKIILGALLMVIMDFFIEPVAIRHDFWAWNHPYVPLQNYLGWFFTSVLLLYFFFRADFSKVNKIAIPLYIIQILFFYCP